MNQFKVGKGKIFGIVGESGSGKSLTALSIMGLTPKTLDISTDSEIIFTPTTSPLRRQGSPAESQGDSCLRRNGGCKKKGIAQLT